MNTEQNHPQQSILKQSFRVPQLLYVKIKDRINCPFFMELYNSVNVHDIEKSKIMLHGIKTLLE
jgi:hypothetical protein